MLALSATRSELPAGSLPCLPLTPVGRLAAPTRPGLQDLLAAWQLGVTASSSPADDNLQDLVKYVVDHRYNMSILRAKVAVVMIGESSRWCVRGITVHHR